MPPHSRCSKIHLLACEDSWQANETGILDDPTKACPPASPPAPTTRPRSTCPGIRWISCTDRWRGCRDPFTRSKRALNRYRSQSCHHCQVCFRSDCSQTRAPDACPAHQEGTPVEYRFRWQCCIRLPMPPHLPPPTHGVHAETVRQ
jgi:hypothetical protein